MNRTDRHRYRRRQWRGAKWIGSLARRSRSSSLAMKQVRHRGSWPRRSASARPQSCGCYETTVCRSDRAACRQCLGRLVLGLSPQVLGRGSPNPAEVWLRVQPMVCPAAVPRDGVVDATSTVAPCAPTAVRTAPTSPGSAPVSCGLSPFVWARPENLQRANLGNFKSGHYYPHLRPQRRRSIGRDPYRGPPPDGSP